MEIGVIRGRLDSFMCHFFPSHRNPCILVSVDNWAVSCAILPASSRGAARTNLWGISMDCPTSLHESPTNSIDGGDQIKNPS